MPRYRLLVFSGNRLTSSESLEAGDHIKAVRICIGRNRSGRMELWWDKGRVARIGPAKCGISNKNPLGRS